MSIWEVIIGIVSIILAILIIVAILGQEGKKSNLSGAIMGGGSDTYLSKNRSRSVDALLERLTKLLLLIFFIVMIVANVISVVGV